MTAGWIALRVMLEIVRDRRTLAYFFVIPVIVMSLVYYVSETTEQGRLVLVTRGAARFFEGDLYSALLEAEDIELISLDVPDEESDPRALESHFLRALDAGETDGVLYMGAELVPERFDGKRGTLHVYVGGARPGKTAAVLLGISDVMDDLVAALPTVIDPSCSAFCAKSVNTKVMDLEEHYLHGDSDYSFADFVMPVLPAFFVFFFTFIISTITFQRERVRGTLERIMVAPVSFGQIVWGYVAGFLIFSLCQAAIIVAYFVALTVFPVSGTQLLSLAVIIVLLQLISLMLGLLTSFVARNEFQAIQFVPLVILPQVFLSDIIWDISNFHTAFRVISYALPLTHANVAVRNVMVENQALWQSWPELAILGLCFLGIYALLVLVGASERIQGQPS